MNVRQLLVELVGRFWGLWKWCLEGRDRGVEGLAVEYAGVWVVELVEGAKHLKLLELPRSRHQHRNHRRRPLCESWAVVCIRCDSSQVARRPLEARSRWSLIFAMDFYLAILSMLSQTRYKSW